MRYAIISDIHGNLEALRAVLEDCRALELNSLLCLGDIVGYGANPKECLSLIRQSKAIIVAGNHDWAVCGRLDASYFTKDGRAAIEWTRGQMNLEEKTYLNSLPLILSNEDCMIVHSSAKNPSQFPYLTDIAKAKEAFEGMGDQKVCFIGHTHEPKLFIKKAGECYELNALDIDMAQEDQYIVNVGSVGQPRDGDSMASFCVYDTIKQTIQIKRCIYDISSAQEKIIQAGLPKTLALRLAKGQ
jgi:predicted phosphodiesterase